MQERHKNRKIYFEEQSYTTEKYVIPYIEPVHRVDGSISLLEVGCGEGGNIKPFLDRGCRCMGVDLNEGQIENGKRFFAEHPHRDRLTLTYSDIYDIEPGPEMQFDIIMLRDVIEHIHDQERFMAFIRRFLRPEGGIIFFAFPPWLMPFGGHQQICESRLAKTPWIHLLPCRAYASLLRHCGESEGRIADLLEIKETGITLERFERAVRQNGYRILRKTHYFINPNYEIKFHLRPRTVLPVLRSIPYLRDFYTTAGYYVVAAK
ncbi:MAG: class I SAM-dependent methyltransferase [Bacteroidales bacterium]|nr:class I SAM-dependent methyltransferase [Bacteroidales bacterium]